MSIITVTAHKRIQVSFYVNNQSELDKLNHLASRDGISKSAVIRQLVLREYRKKDKKDGE